MQLNPKRYEFLTNEELIGQNLPTLNAEEGNRIGLLAQEVESLFPELVTEVVHVLDRDENAGDDVKPETVTSKAINYQELTVVLLAAIQELQAEVESLKNER